MEQEAGPSAAELAPPPRQLDTDSHTPPANHHSPAIPEPPPLHDASALASSAEGSSQGAATLQSMADSSNAAERQLNVTDALSYLDAVKVQFQERPDVYNVFLDIMKDFKSQLIDTPGVISRVSTLFRGHPNLIQGFNTFLPVGYRIDVSQDARSNDFITVTTPSGTMRHAMAGPPGLGIDSGFPGQAEYGASPYAALGLGPPSVLPPSQPPPHKRGTPEASSDDVSRQSLKPAMDYVQKIKTRFSNDPETYKQFLEILSNHKFNANNEEVFARVEILFKDAPDLAAAFREFLGQSEAGETTIRGMLQDRPRTATPAAMAEHTRPGKRKQPPEPTPAAAPSSVPAKRKRKTAADKEKDKEKEPAKASRSKKGKQPAVSAAEAEPSFSQYATIPPPSPRRAHHAPTAPPPPPPRPTPQDEQFFDRVLIALDSRETYNEFLRLINLFTQNFIDRARLVHEGRSFLGDGELMHQFKEILGWDENMERATREREREEVATTMTGRSLLVLDRPTREELNVRYGSYRKLPVHERDVQCSGRDEMCKSVLNDEWISHPTFASEDSGFIAHKKNIYEEALHRSEEERHEYDFHIDGLVRTIALLEPINNKIAQLVPEERVNFKLKPNLNGLEKAIHQRIVKKIYGREPGLEVVRAMQETPALAIPVVLTRLKQKEEEWKRAQREWNKVWREVDRVNYHKALDHQAITFRAADRKALTTKAFVTEIELKMEEQVNKRAILIDPLFARQRPRHQLEYVLDDSEVLKDAVKLTFSFLSRLSAQQLRLDNGRRNWIEVRIFNIVRSFFMLDDGWVEVGKKGKIMAAPSRNGAMPLENGASSSEDTEMASVASTSKAGKNGLTGNFSGDLRKNLLKAEQAKSARGQMRPLRGTESPSTSRMSSPAPTSVFDEEMPTPAEDKPLEPGPQDTKRRSKRRSFFTNTWFYTFLRLVQVIYSRLHLFKTIGARVAQEGRAANRQNPSAKNLGLPSLAELAGVDEETIGGVQYYEYLLETCERLFDNQIEQAAFEDQIRYIFGLKDAYKIFTIDKVLGSLIKHVQSWEQDPKLDKLVKLLWDERHLETPTAEDHRAQMRQAEETLGPDENLFRIDWIPDTKTMTFQLLNKDGSSLDDAEVISGRWQAYIESFTSEGETKNIPQSKVRRPFLRRLLPKPLPAPPRIRSRGGLEIKVCVRTYRLFFVSHTEDFLWRFSAPAEFEEASAKLHAREALRKQWLERLEADQRVPAPATAPVRAAS